MKQIITDIEKLTQAAKPVKFIDDSGNINKTECLEIINDIKEVLTANPNIIALCAPQIGIDARVICIKFNDGIKTFVNPVVTKKLKYSIGAEVCASMPGKEILITRPEEILTVYYTDELKYEDNKLLGVAARLFDQQYQLLDGVIPSELGLISEPEVDGSVADLTEEEFQQVVEIYKQFIKSKVSTLEKDLEGNEELAKEFRSLKFTESVITGHASIVTADKETTDRYKKAQATAAMSLKVNEQNQKNAQRAQLNKYLNHKGKSKKKGK